MLCGHVLQYEDVSLNSDNHDRKDIIFSCDGSMIVEILGKLINY